MHDTEVLRQNCVKYIKDNLHELIDELLDEHPNGDKVKKLKEMLGEFIVDTSVDNVIAQMVLEESDRYIQELKNFLELENILGLNK